ncbi:MAG: tRNA (guanosine(37)-N1)-methyltransferase TrmD [Lachnospiraceae bacterium]|nr:tRNA (guanosine(37)-N1)-methyltransferase TrmD [Lachnospiraceae bacterium]MDE6624789.1 tRNA (guanosine(37)-N1)-methyltransferase TrmD [Lachnospiraceae bacterium]
MHFHIMTLFPEMVTEGLNTSVIGRGIKNGYISVEAVNIRDFADNKHGQVDDYPYGGGAGMVMQPGPVYRTWQHVVSEILQRKKSEHGGRLPETEERDLSGEETDRSRPRVVYMTPQGRVFNQSIARELAKEEDLILLCGHYEGIDERVLEMIVTDNLSIGDYVLTGGELPAMVVVDAVSRLVPGVLSNNASAEFETFYDNLLEYPQYTRPEQFMEKNVPDVLLSGHHQRIETWRREQSIKRTRERRPDLLAEEPEKGQD